MSNDVILDATVKFIMEDVEHLNLAFRVEEAMPHVRETLVREVLDGIKRHFSEGDWEIFEPHDKNILNKNARLILRKRGWPKSADDNETGIQLRAGASNWNSVYIGLHLSNKIEEKIKEQTELEEELAVLCSEESKHKLERAESGLPMWNWLKDCSNIPGDWSKEDFLQKALNSSSSKSLVSELTAIVEEWADLEKTQKILSLVERSCAE